MIYSSIKYHKKRYLLLIAILTLSYLMFFFNGFMFSGIKNSISSFYEKRYGLFQCVIFDSDEGQKDLLRENGFEIGSFYIKGNYDICENDQALTVGSFSPEALKMGNIELLDGRFPEKDDEIALERYTMKYMLPPGTDIGSVISLKDNEGQLTEYIVTGIVSDYHLIWNVPSGVIIPGKNDYPTGLIVSRDGSENVMIYKDAEIDRFLSPILNIVSDLGCSEDDYAVNYHLYEDVYRDVFGELEQYKRILSLVLFLSSVTSAIIMVSLILDGYIETFRKYKYLGASDGYLLRKTDLEFAAVCLPVYVLFSVLSLIFMPEIFIFLTLVTFIVMLSVNILVYLSLKFRIERKDRIASKDIKFNGNKNISGFIFSVFSRNNVKRVMPALFILSLVLTAVATFFFIATNTVYGYETFGSDFSLDNIGKNGFTTIKAIRLMPEDNVYALNEAYRLFDLKNDLEHIDFSYFENGNIILDRNDSFYWAQLTAMDLYADDPGHLSYVPGMPKDFQVIDGLVIQLIPEGYEDDILSFLPDLPLTEMKDNGSVVLILPPLSYNEKEYRNDIIKKGDILRFARFEHRNVPDVSDLSVSDLTYREFAFPIEYIYEEDISDDSFIIFDSPCVLIPESVSERSGFITGLESMDIYLKSGISDERYDKVQEMLLDISQSVKNSNFYSKQETKESNMRIINLVRNLLYILLGTFGLSAMISVCMIIYLNLISRRQTVGILRALGTGRSSVDTALAKELFVYSLILILMTWIFTLTVLDRIFILENVLFYWKHLKSCLYTLLILSVMVLIIVPFVFPWFISRKLFKEDLSDLLKYPE